MKVLKIITAPDPLLDTPSKNVLKIDTRIRKLIEDMEATLVVQSDPQGVGLAAVQIGMPLALFIMKENPKAKTQVFINPKLITNDELRIMNNESDDADFLRLGGGAGTSTTTELKKSASNDQKPKSTTKSSLEGCLSVPRIWSPIKRNKKVSIHFLDITGIEKTAELTGLKATIVQHELDHLAGILFTRRALEQKSQLFEEVNGKLKKMKY